MNVLRIKQLPSKTESKTLTLDVKEFYTKSEPGQTLSAFIQSLYNKYQFTTLELLNIREIEEDTVKALTTLHLEGVTISINENTLNNVPRVKPKWEYFSQTLYQWDIPKDLLTFLKKKRTSTITETLLNEYNEQVKERVYNHNRINWIYAEDFIKQLLDLIPQIKVFSPNKKVYLEWISEKRFQEELPQPTDRTLTKEQILDLEQNAKYYGVDVPTLNYRIKTNSTPQGYTMERERVIVLDKSTFSSQTNGIDIDYEYLQNIPYSIRKDCKTYSIENMPLLVQAYDTLNYLRQYGDEFLLTQYKRCPICNRIYNENVGCIDELDLQQRKDLLNPHYHVEPIHLVNTPKLFYGISSEYEEIGLY